MPRGYCLYPQDTTVDGFFDDGKTPNPDRCPYRTRWKPYVTKAGNLCCQRAYVPKKDRYDLNDSRIPRTHLNFSDERPPKRDTAPSPQACASQGREACRANKRCEYVSENKESGLDRQCRPRTPTPTRNCPEGSRCLSGRCTPKFVKRFDREFQRVCSDKYRCVLPDSVAWKRSGCREGGGPGVKEDSKPPAIKKVTHRRRGCREFQELKERDRKPSGWCPVPRCYRHTTEDGTRLCLSEPPSPLSPAPSQESDDSDDSEAYSDWDVKNLEELDFLGS